jgi:hypothetical protein
MPPLKNIHHGNRILYLTICFLLYIADRVGKMSGAETFLPLGYESFKDEIRTLFSLSKEDLASVLDELERRGKSFSDQSINIMELDDQDKIGIRNILIYLVPKVKGNEEVIGKELMSMGVDVERINFFVKKVLSLKEDTYLACQIQVAVANYLSDRKHVGEITSELNLAPIRIDGDKGIWILPVINLIMKTHGHQNNVNEEFSVTMDTGMLQNLIDNLLLIMSNLKSEKDELKNLIGDQLL